ncbi:hypothetical protein DH2020_030271 [Rehmannia glutinosa]|uniref:NB-ARC domain-containing protein n=1 Tax=Rehmannia glutinosa TaxID=99300 RepID=A0ABR0VLD7_REHGL
MAYAALISLAQTIHKILNNDQYTVSDHEKQQITCIHEHVIFLQTFLEDFPEKAKNLEGRIRDVTNEAEDTIEYFMSEQITPHIGYQFHPMEKVREQIESTVGEVMRIKINSFKIKDVGYRESPAASSSSRLVPTDKNDMVGFDDDLIAIKGRLCGGSSKLQVIPIFGMGGIGKTTLAKHAYDDPLIMEYFDIRAWVTVSQDYRVKEILSGLLVSVEVFNTRRSSERNESVAEKVYKSLKGQRYLIVLDDMWSANFWDDVKMIFPDDDNCSRIILTTRLSDVAAYADPCSPLHEMHFMDVDQSWNLLRHKVFKKGNCPRELKNIGKKIARSCRGLPLAIAVIAGLLSTVSQTKASWENIAENVSLAVTTDDEQFAKILFLSYNHLPHHLRPCFLYMGGFPENYEIHVSKLIKLWVAEGFLKTSGLKSLEEEAEEYLADLVKRSLFFVKRRKSNGKIKSCSVHDLVRDLCIRIAQQEKFLLHVMERSVGETILESIKNQRRVTINHSNFSFAASICGSSIRTVICFQSGVSYLGSLVNFRLLRVLNVVNSNTEALVLLPAQIFELFHLRYLAFDYHIMVPAAISNLQNLQTLIILTRKELRRYLSLPMEIWRMPQLRHLVSSYFSLLPNPQGANFPLQDLQTLSVAINLICTAKMLKMIPNLKKLGIIYFGDVYDQDFRLENLIYLRQLEELKLKTSSYFPFRPTLNPTFPEKLKKLTLSGWEFPWNNMKIVGSLPNLEVLKLRDSACDGSKWETSEGEFRRLKFLLIDDSDPQHWITESSHFPRLKCLVLRCCWRLSEIPEGIGEIPTLELIEVKASNKYVVESAKWIQEQQQSWGNDAFQVRCEHY